MLLLLLVCVMDWAKQTLLPWLGMLTKLFHRTLNPKEIHSLSIYLLHIHPNTHTYSLSISIANTHTHTRSFFISLTHSLSLTSFKQSPIFFFSEGDGELIEKTYVVRIQKNLSPLSLSYFSQFQILFLWNSIGKLFTKHLY